MSTTTRDTTASSQSTMSKISINRNLAKKLSNNRKSNVEISADQISFGSNKKK